MFEWQRGNCGSHAAVHWLKPYQSPNRLPLSGGSFVRAKSLAAVSENGNFSTRQVAEIAASKLKEGRTETFQKSRKPAIGRLSSSARDIPTDTEWLAEAEDFEPRYGEFEIRCSPLSERSGRTSSAKVHKRFQTFEFREPYRRERVQSFGEKLAFRRTIGRRCRSEVQSPNEKSLLLLGPIAQDLPQRIHSLGQFGGESGIRTHGSDCGLVFAPSPRIKYRVALTRQPIFTQTWLRKIDWHIWR
jgi:hypothetical protein